MNTFRFGFRLLTAMTLIAGLAGTGIAAPPTVEQVLLYKPRQSVEISTPSSAEMTACTVELEKGKPTAAGKTPTAWVLKDGQGRVLRKFHDTTGENKVNRWSYYRDGQEVYREEDSNGNTIPDQYRWLGVNGSKWGVNTDEDEKNTIDTWVVISPEEVSQEILAATVTRDFKRLQALMINQADLQSLGLPATELERLKEKMDKAGVQFQKTCAELVKLSEKTAWVHLETKLPETIPADTLGSKADLIHYRHATILYQDGDGKESKHNWLQTGEMIQVGKAWRIVSAPVPGVHVDQEARNNGTNDTQIPIPTGAEKIIEELKALDANQPGRGREEIVAYNLKRAAILEKIAMLITKPEDASKRDVWVKQIAECYAAASQQGDKSALERLGAWRTSLAKEQAGSAILAFITYREMSGEYAQKLTAIGSSGKPDEMSKLQDSWKEKLAKYVSDFPTSEDTPDVLMQLGMVNEFVGKETDAKNWYSLLVKNFPKSNLVRKATGCLDRLNIEGKEFELVGPTLGAGTAFDVKSLKGKPVVVYYWASWNGAATSDFNKIKLALQPYGAKVELVCVNLDNAVADAVNFLKGNNVAGTHLFQTGGLESPLALQYGITVLPNMFLVGADGKVASRSVQSSTLEDELKKIIKDPKDK